MHHRPVVRTPAPGTLRLAAVCALGWAVGLLSVGAPATAQTRGLLPADYYAEVGVGEVAISPDGGLVAFTVTTVVEEENRRHREIWMQQLRGGRPEGEPFRFTDPTREASGPRWSPDGRTLSFRSPRGDGDDAGDTWFARVAFPGGEAYRVEGVRGAPTWSPDGAWIAYTAPPEERRGGSRGNAPAGSRPTRSPAPSTLTASTAGSSPPRATSATARSPCSPPPRPGRGASSSSCRRRAARR
ncbi:MAG: hypothetical protein OXG35_12660, partial [Acidobacteria bacterium]|nr:hypothetical protein [Acidobacteriota bacterium]